MISKRIEQEVFYWAHDIRIHSIGRDKHGTPFGQVRVRGGWTPNPGREKPPVEVVTDLDLAGFAASVGTILGCGPMAVIDAISQTIEGAVIAQETPTEEPTEEPTEQA